MSFDYADLAATAVELLADFGMAMTLTRPTDIPATYDTATGVATPVGPDIYTVTGIKLDYSVLAVTAMTIPSRGPNSNPAARVKPNRNSTARIT